MNSKDLEQKLAEQRKELIAEGNRAIKAIAMEIKDIGLYLQRRGLHSEAMYCAEKLAQYPYRG